MLKPRFNRSSPAPTILKAEDLKGNKHGGIAQKPSTGWRPVSIKTLGYLAAKAKIGIMQVHQRLGDAPNKVFAKAFLDNVDLDQPTKKEMDQIQLFSHLLFA